MRRKKIQQALHNILITGFAAEGKSIAKHEGKVIFVPGAIPGDRVDLLITRSKKDWAEARITTLIEPAANRLIPFCKHFGTCGGCKWQMLPYADQLAYKQQEAIQNILRIAKVEPKEILPILGSEETTAYRNKLEFTFSNKRYLSFEEVKSAALIIQENALGYHAPGVFDKVIDIEECFLMDEVNNLIRNSIRDFALQHQLSFYDIKEHSGWLRNIIIRKCSTGNLLVNLCLHYEDESNRVALLDFLLEKVPSITTLLYTINPKWNDSIYDLEPVVYSGPGYVIEKLGSLSFKIGPKSFFQTNSHQGKRLYDVVKDFAGLNGWETVYDLYCGTGSIGLYLHDVAKKIIGVETVAEAIEDAKENAGMNHISNAQFFAGDVIKICNADFFAEQGKPDLVITDPPRAGMHEKLITTLMEIEPPRIVYVSCNTATQARDIGILSEKYDLLKLRPVDMFPHTHHIECVALLQLKKNVNYFPKPSF